MAPVVCRYGTKCRRANCYYEHPEGRELYGSSDADAAAPAVPAAAAAVQYVSAPRQPHIPAGAGAMASGASILGSSPSASGPSPCWYGANCRRPDCYFSHPPTRSLEPHGAAPRAQAQPLLPHALPPQQHHGRRASPATGSGPGDSPHEDQWFPSARECPCCSGYIYRCGKPACVAQGQCHCSVGSHPAGTPEVMAAAVTSLRAFSPSPDTPTGSWNGSGSGSGSGSAPGHWQAQYQNCRCCHGYVFDCQDPTCESLGICGCAVDDPELNADDDDDFGGASSQGSSSSVAAAPLLSASDYAYMQQAISDEMGRLNPAAISVDDWFPASRDCSCCQGFVYRCAKQLHGCADTCSCHS